MNRHHSLVKHNVESVHGLRRPRTPRPGSDTRDKPVIPRVENLRATPLVSDIYLPVSTRNTIRSTTERFRFVPPRPFPDTMQMLFHTVRLEIEHLHAIIIVGIIHHVQGIPVRVHVFRAESGSRCPGHIRVIQPESQRHTVIPTRVRHPAQRGQTTI